MFANYFAFGFPFNPVDSKNFTEISSVVRTTGLIKKLIKSKTPIFDVVAAKETPYQNMIESSDNILFLGNEVPTNTLDEELFSADMLRHVEMLESAGDNRVFNRYMLVNTDSYISCVQEQSFLKNTFTPSRGQIIYRNIGSFAKKRAGVDDIFDEKGTNDILDNMRSDYPHKSERAKRLSFLIKLYGNCFSSDDLKQKCLVTLADLAIEDLENKTNVSDAVKYLWALSVYFTQPELFYIIYQEYKPLITVEEFPWLYFSALDRMIDFVKEKGGLSWCLADAVCFEVSEVLKNEYFDDKRVHASLCEIFSFDGAFVNQLDTSVAMIKDIQAYTEELYALISKMDESVADELKKQVYDLLPKPEAVKPTELKDLWIILLNNIQTIEKDCEKVIADLPDTKGIEKSIQKHESEAMALAKAPLDNIARLTELAAMKEKDVTSLAEVSSIKSAEAEPAKNKYIEAIKRFAEDYAKIAAAQKDNLSEKELLDVVIEEVNELEGQVRDLRGQLHSKTELASKLQNQVEKLQSSSFSVCGDVELSGLMLKIHNGRATVHEVMQAVLMINGDSMVISQSLMDDIEKQNGFERSEVLFKKILLLTSQQFADTYSEKGSNGCFSLFTKTELAFRESSGTQSSYPRVFNVDGQDYDCKAHLKIGKDNTAQNMLRVYFAVDGGKVIIGNVERHMPTMGRGD
jgi:hypothetical protein